eukprot:4483958-Pyramimonas_sp.AAC.2
MRLVSCLREVLTVALPVMLPVVRSRLLMSGWSSLLRRCCTCCCALLRAAAAALCTTAATACLASAPASGSSTASSAACNCTAAHPTRNPPRSSVGVQTNERIPKE